MKRAPSASDIESQAARWLIRLDADPSVGMRLAFQSWLEVNARRRAAYLRLEKAWCTADRLRNLRPWDGSVSTKVLDAFPDGLRGPDEPDGPPTPTHRARKFLRSFCAATLAVAILASVWIAWSQSVWKVYRTQLGGFAQVVLEDGTRAQLNTASEIRVRMGYRGRDVQLTRGEVLFDVAHDASRPFTVVAANTSVRAVGTSFAVRLRGQRQVEVMVAQGTVAVQTLSRANPPARSMLSAGDTLLTGVGPDRPAHGGTDVISHKLAWTHGRIWLDQTTLVDAVAEFNRYNRRQVTIADPSIASLRMGGAFNATDPDAFVTALSHVFPVEAVPAQHTPGSPDVLRLIRAPASRPASGAGSGRRSLSE